VNARVALDAPLEHPHAPETPDGNMWDLHKREKEADGVKKIVSNNCFKSLGLSEEGV
jgi:hypothetical protein